MKNFVLCLFLFNYLGCEERFKQLDSRNCKVFCYESGNEAPVYETNCPHDPHVSIGEETANITFFVKSRQFPDYEPFDKISKNLDKYESCVIHIKSKGYWR